MKILLIGEYSNFHNTLKEGLLTLDHEVVICSDKDGFKNYDSDFSVHAKWFHQFYILNAIRQIINRLFKFDVAQLENGYRFYKLRKHLVNFDVVQLVNEHALQSLPYFERKIISYLEKNNGKLFLVSCGDDYPCVTYMKEGHFRYSVLTPCIEDPSRPHCEYILRYLKPEFKKLHEHVYNNIQGVITADLDYDIPLRNHPYYLGLVPHPINCDRIKMEPLQIGAKIIIFHGINQVNYYKKGNNFFEEALQIIKEKYGNKIEVITTISLPYQEYIKLFNTAHIVLDQAYSYDQGYNALEAMAKGKVVFTGAEKEFYEHYQLTETVAINALPNTSAIVKELSYLIENPLEIIKIGKNARHFIEEHHHYIKNAKKYIAKWNV